MPNNLRALAPAVAVTLVLTQPVFASAQSRPVILEPAQTAQNTDDLTSVISNSIYFVPQTGQLTVNELQVRNVFTGVELDDDVFSQARAQLASLDDEEVDRLLIQSGYNPAEVRVENDQATASVAPIIWIAGIAIAALTTGALIWVSKYYSHKEKMRLIDQCYANGGYPEVDSRDKGGVKGTTKSGEARSAGGYNFKCRKR